MRVTVTTAQPEHVAPVAAGMRAADRAEIWATSRSLPEGALRRGLSGSTAAWVGLYDDEPVCLFGVAPRSLVTGEGTPWMLGTDRMVRHQRALLRASWDCLAAMLAVYPSLTNYVDDRNDASKRWLRWLGFKLDEPVPYGVGGLPFRRFHLEVQ